jgi:hypothetical protein
MIYGVLMDRMHKNKKYMKRRATTILDVDTSTMGRHEATTQ